MDKKVLNHQIVQMRKFVKQGKVHLMSKLVKEAQLLKNRKGKEHQVAKCKRKAERLLQQIAILKKITPDSVSKMALSKTKDWKAVLSQKGISLENRCYAWLANYGPVQAEVQNFYKENSYLIPKIPILILEWDEKAVSMIPLKNKKLLQAKSKSKEKTNQTSIERNKLVTEELNMPELESYKQPVKKISKKKNIVSETEIDYIGSEDDSQVDSVTEELNMPELESCKQPVKKASKKKNIVSETENDDISSEEDSQVDSDDNLVESDDNQVDSDDHLVESGENKIESDDNQVESDESDMHSGEEDSYNSLHNKNKILSNKKQFKNNLNKNSKKNLYSSVVTANELKNKIPSLQKDAPLESNSTKAVAFVNMNELMDMDEIPIKSNVTEKDLSNESRKRKKDSFFLKDGEEFSESDQSEGENSNDDERTDHTMHKNSFNKKRPLADHRRKGWEENSSNFKKSRFSTNTPQVKEFGNRDKNRNDFHSKKVFKKYDKNEKKPYSDQKGFSQNKWNSSDKSNGKGFKPFNSFQGKKEMFKNKSDKHPKNNSHTIDQTAKKDPPLHPSWEAKRKLKQATNTKFQGKRMVFND